MAGGLLALRGGFMTCRMNGRLPSAALRLFPDGEPTTATGRSPDFADHRRGELPSRFPSGVWLTQLPAHSYGHSAGFPPASLFTRTLPGTCCVTGRVMRFLQRGKRQGFGLRRWGSAGYSPGAPIPQPSGSVIPVSPEAKTGTQFPSALLGPGHLLRKFRGDEPAI